MSTWQDDPPDHPHNAAPYGPTGDDPIRDRSAVVVGFMAAALSGAAVATGLILLAVWAGWIG